MFGKGSWNGGMLALHGAFHGCLLEKQQFVSLSLPLQLCVLPSSVGTMAFCGGQQERREEEKDAEQVCLNWEDEVCILL